ncbi:MAG: hypothetical protein U9O94_00810 [Nanoarchaeota archaeon]|nr:hypothetical protein [Nanoarchaeota archaeon]
MKEPKPELLMKELRGEDLIREQRSRNPSDWNSVPISSYLGVLSLVDALAERCMYHAAVSNYVDEFTERCNYPTEVSQERDPAEFLGLTKFLVDDAVHDGSSVFVKRDQLDMYRNLLESGDNYQELSLKPLINKIKDFFYSKFIYT